jgi:hypothetical protein
LRSAGRKLEQAASFPGGLLPAGQAKNDQEKRLKGREIMNDARWLRLWCARHVRATSGDSRTKAEELARKAKAAAARDGFSVDAALREEGHASLADHIRSVLRRRADSKAKRAASRHENTGPRRA